jgi:hypothetical protein
MSSLSIQPTYPIFTETDGQPLENGYIWIGQVNLDPQVNPINVYFDVALTILAPQPIRTINGYPSRNGTPARLYVNSDYSIRVQDKNGSTVYSAPTATERYSDVVVGSVNAADVFYDPAGTGAVQTTQQAVNRRSVWIEDFLPANFNILTDDAAPYIQAAISTGASEINIEDKTYLTDSPIYLDGGQALIGQGIDKTIIKKRTTTAGTGSNTARGGAVTDSYAVNAIIICRHPNDGFNYRTRFENLTLSSDGYIVEYGIYAPRMSQLYMRQVHIYQCRFGYFTYDSWLSTMIACIFNADTQRNLNGNNYGWPDVTPSYGVNWENDGSGSATGTSLAMIDCWARDCHYGYHFYGLQYSSMNSCAADNISFRAYWIHLSKMTFNGCACENVRIAEKAAWYFESSQCVVNSCQSLEVQGVSSGTTACVFMTGTNCTFNNCVFEDFVVTPGTSNNVIIQSGSQITISNTTFPTNGDAFISYSGGSQLVNLTDSTPYVISGAVSSSARYWKGRVRDNQVQEGVNKAVVSAGTVIATLTAAGGSFDRGVCEFTVSYSDLPSPTGVGISKFLVSVLKEGANYRENVSTITAAYATVGGAGAPTFTLSRVGNVWSLTMTPQDGDCTAHTITAEMQNITGITLALP